MEKIITFFSPTNLKLIFVGILLVLVGAVVYLNNSKNKLKTQLAISDQNNKALSDTLRVSKTKDGKTEASKDVIISSSDDLKKLNTDLANELKKENGKIFELNQIITNIKQTPGDTIKINNTETKYANGAYDLSWTYDTLFDAKNSRHVRGLNILKLKDTTILSLKTFILEDTWNFNLVTGLRENTDGNLEIFVRSNYPNFKVTSLEGAIIDPEKNPIIQKFTNTYKFHVGPYIGVGFDGKLNSSIQFGVGLQYSLFGFNF